MWNVQPTRGFTCSTTAVDLCWNPLWLEPFGRLRLHRQVLQIPFWLKGFPRDFFCHFANWQEHIRLVGLSATLPNYEDVAVFLRVDVLSESLTLDETHEVGNGWKWMNDKMLESRWIQRKAFTTLEIIIVQFHWSRPTLVRAPGITWESFAVAWLDGRVFYYESIQVSRIRRLSSVSTPWTKCATRSSWRMLARIRQSIFI